jgi:hypothetical protein
MATVINNPGGTEGSGTGVVVGILIVVLVVILLLVFGLPYLRNRGVPAPANNGGANINVQLPDTSGGAPAPTSNGATQY